MARLIKSNLKRCMDPNKIISLKHYDEIVKKYNFRSSYSNNYMLREEVRDLISNGSLNVFSTGYNLFFIIQKPKCFRLYYYLNDLSELMFFDKENLVTEILYRGDDFYPEVEVDFFLKCGFSKNLIRDQYSGVYKNLTIARDYDSISVKIATTMEEIKYACELFNNSFDPFSGDFILESKYETLQDNGDIVVATLDNQLIGALHQTLKNNVAWISHVAVDEYARGRHVGQALVDFYVTRNMSSEKSRYMFWVQRQNMPAINMYQKKGFKYINKSTISLLKINK